MTPANDEPPLIDYHVHLEHGLDLSRALELSAERGVRFGIVEHGGRGQRLGSDRDLEAYLATLRGRPVLAGMQAEGLDWMDCFSAPMIRRLDYVLTDALTFPYRGRVLQLWRPQVRVPDPEDFIDRYLEYSVGILTTQPVQILANPTFLPACLQGEYARLWTTRRMDRFIRAAVENQVALEINARYRVPSPEFVRRGKEAGVRFAFGSNAHGEEVGRLEYCLDIARQCALGRDDLFLPA